MTAACRSAPEFEPDRDRGVTAAALALQGLVSEAPVVVQEAALQIVLARRVFRDLAQGDVA